MQLVVKMSYAFFLIFQDVLLKSFCLANHFNAKTSYPCPKNNKFWKASENTLVFKKPDVYIAFAVKEAEDLFLISKTCHGAFIANYRKFVNFYCVNLAARSL